MEGSTGSAECGRTGKGGTGGIAEGPIGAPIGTKLIGSVSDLGKGLVENFGLEEGDETAVALEEL